MCSEGSTDKNPAIQSIFIMQLICAILGAKDILVSEMDKVFNNRRCSPRGNLMMDLN